VASFNTDNLSVSIDPLTHIATIFVDPGAPFGSETVIFRVEDFSGISAQDTMLVTIRSGGAGSGGAFSLTPLPALEAEVGQLVPVIDLVDYLITPISVSDSSITFRVDETGNVGVAITSFRRDPQDEDGFRWDLSVFSTDAGTDTIRIIATDSLGRSEVATTTVRYFGASERLDLHSLPDIFFIAGRSSEPFLLNDFIVDRETHPDSVMEWSVRDISTSGEPIVVNLKDDSSILAFATDIVQREFVIVARDTALNVTGRDTVRIISQDPALGEQELQPFPDLVLQAGGIDSSIVLNDFLPEGVTPASTAWSVSGQSLTAPVIDREIPHILRVTGLGNSLGVDTLSLRVDLGGGFVATGDLVVNVIEPIDESTLEMQVVPNPINPQYLNFFVIARTELASSPTVVVTFNGDSTVAVRQIEEDLSSGVLIWGGSYRAEPDAAGTVTFRATALTALGSSVTSAASIAVGELSSGKVLALRHGPVQITAAGSASHSATTVVLQSRYPIPETARRIVGVTGPDDSELMPLLLFDLYPSKLQLATPTQLVVEGVASGMGLYRALGDDTWEWAGRVSQDASGQIGGQIERFGQYQIAADFTAPRIQILDSEPGRLTARITDRGAGVDITSLAALLDGERLPMAMAGDLIIWELSSDRLGELTQPLVEIRVSDRAANETSLVERIDGTYILPRQAQLGENFPNPFNPETTIPFVVPAAGDLTGDSRVQLVIYNTAGQQVRLLLDGGMQPGQHQILWDGRDALDRPVGSGIYFYRLTLVPGGTQQTRSMMLLK
jgi:hypothetical protein